MTFFEIEKLEQDCIDLIEIIDSYRQLTDKPTFNPLHSRYLACHRERLTQLDAHIAELRGSRMGHRRRQLLPAA
jgi:hypothetical protein